MNRSGLSVVTMFAIVAVVLLLSAGQVLFKYAANGLDFSKPVSFLSVPLAVALAVYGIATLCWLLVLTKVPLSVAFPFYGLVFLLVPVFSWLILKESLRAPTIIGGVIIAVGVVIVALGSRA